MEEKKTYIGELMIMRRGQENPIFLCIRHGDTHGELCRKLITELKQRENIDI